MKLKRKLCLTTIVMRTVTGHNVVAGVFTENFRDTLKSFVAKDEAYSFMNNVKGSPAYWKHMLSDVLAMVKQLGLPLYLLTLSYADLHWDELVIIISKLKGCEIS